MQEIASVSGGDAIEYIVQTVDSDLLQHMTEQLEVTNTLLLRTAERIDFFGAVFIAVVVVAVCYIILKSFSRF